MQNELQKVKFRFGRMEKCHDWGYLTFFRTYSDQIEKIAIVAPARWETD